MVNDRLLRADERLANVQWPDLQQIKVPHIGSDDCLLVCGGFEERAIETLHRTCASGRSGFALGLVTYRPMYPQNRTDELRQIGRDAHLQITEFVYDRENPAGIGEELKPFTQDFAHVFVDISGMSRLLIVQTLVALLAGSHNPAVTIIYGEAKEYPPTKAQFAQDRQRINSELVLSYISSGIFEVASTPELASVSMLGEAIRLVAFPSFDPAQLSNLIQELQPTYTELIHGVPPAPKNKWRAKAIDELNRPTLNALQHRADHMASTRDYRETLRILIKVYGERSMFDRIVVAPTGSKMQAVAVGLFRSVMYDVQIVYPTPQIFIAPHEHTIGIRQLYKVDLPTEAMRVGHRSVEGHC
jgi:hypothetical protein